MNQLTILFIIFFSYCNYSIAQHNNEFYNNGALIKVQSGAEIHVLGDAHMYGATGVLSNDGLIKTQGNTYSDNLFQQTGAGTYRIQNSAVNIGERQFISGSCAVRGTQASIGVNDGSFYNLELANDQGIVYLIGAGNVADVRNSVNFNSSGIVNRIVTHNIGISGAITFPANGSSYTSIFGLMNSNTGIGNLLNNTVTTNGNMSGVDNGYIQGKFRRAISPVGGLYNFVLGLEPAGVIAKRGMQYTTLNFAANNYDVISGYFQSGSSNAGSTVVECSGNTINYWGGVDHGEWVFTDSPGSGSGTYEIQVWPQDHTLITSPVWVITKDDALSGTVDQCGPTTVGLTRGGLNGFSEFGVAAPISALPIELIDISAQGVENYISVIWNVATEINLSHYSLERSEDGFIFTPIADIAAQGVINQYQTYSYDDFDVRYFQNFYYRVKSVDIDGLYDYTPVVVANIKNNDLLGFTETAVNLFPNPSMDDFALSFNSTNNLAIQMQVFNSLGQLISIQNFEAGIGNTIVSVNSKPWNTGVYNIKLTDTISGKTIIKRFIKN